MDRGQRVGRLFAAASAVTGLVTLLAAGRLTQAIGRPGAVPDPRIVRVLGARQVVQAGLTVMTPTGPVLALGSAVDAGHAASMVALAGVSPRFRRPALISAAMAGLAAAVGARLATRSGI